MDQIEFHFHSNFRGGLGGGGENGKGAFGDPKGALGDLPLT